MTLWYSTQQFSTATPHSYIMHYEAWSILLAALHLVHTNPIGPCTWDGQGEPQLVTRRHDTSVVSSSNVQVELRLSTLFMHCTPFWYCRVCISLNNATTLFNAMTPCYIILSVYCCYALLFVLNVLSCCTLFSAHHTGQFNGMHIRWARYAKSTGNIDMVQQSSIFACPQTR